MDAQTVEQAQGLMQRLGEAPGPDRELDLQVFSFLKGEPLEWAETDRPLAERTLVRPAEGTGIRPADGDGLPGWGDVSRMPGVQAFALPPLTASTDESIAQVKAAGFIGVEVEFHLSEKLRRHVQDEAHIRTWRDGGRGPTYSGRGFSPGLAICRALVLAILGRAGHVPDEYD